MFFITIAPCASMDARPCNGRAKGFYKGPFKGPDYGINHIEPRSTGLCNSPLAWPLHGQAVSQTRSSRTLKGCGNFGIIFIIFYFYFLTFALCPLPLALLRPLTSPSPPCYIYLVNLRPFDKLRAELDTDQRSHLTSRIRATNCSLTMVTEERKCLKTSW